MNTSHNPTPQLNTELLSALATIDRADRWLSAVLPVARNHPEYADAIEGQATRKFSGRELENVRRQFESLHAEAGLGSLFADYQQANSAPLTPTILDVAEKIASAVPVEECLSMKFIAGDPELTRLAVALNQAPQARLWLVLFQMVRNTNINHVLRADLEAALPAYGITVSERNLRRWLYRGHGLFWELTDQHVYFAGYETVARRLIEIALDHKLTDLISTNRPGKRSMYIDVSGSLQQFEANVYAAWLASRENPVIARSTLSALWKREPRILRKWEKLAGVEVVTNEVQYHPDYNGDVPQHAYMYRAGIGQGRSETRWRARMVNTYHTPQIRQHHKRGASRRVFRVIREYLESIQPAGICEQDLSTNGRQIGGLKPTGRRYFHDSTKARRSAKRLGNRPRYISLGADDHNREVWDYAPDGIQRTTAGEELPLITQRKFTPRPVYAKDVIYG